MSGGCPQPSPNAAATSGRPGWRLDGHLDRAPVASGLGAAQRHPVEQASRQPGFSPANHCLPRITAEAELTPAIGLAQWVV
jgi:hypothetical protein